MTDVDSTDDVALLASTPPQAEFQLLSLHKETRGISFYMSQDTNIPAT